MADLNSIFGQIGTLVGQQIKALKDQVVTLENLGSADDFQTALDNGYPEGTTPDTIMAQVGELLRNEMGDRDNLTTTDKSTIVAAINELVTALAGKAASSAVGNLAALTTGDKTSLVAAINAVMAGQTALLGTASVAGNTLGKLEARIDIAEADIIAIDGRVDAAEASIDNLNALVAAATEKVVVADLAARNALTIPTNGSKLVFVSNDGDGKWALYHGIADVQSNIVWVKISDPDLLGAVMTNEGVLAALLANADVNVVTDAQLQKLTDLPAATALQVSLEGKAGGVTYSSEAEMTGDSVVGHTVALAYVTDSGDGTPAIYVKYPDPSGGYLDVRLDGVDARIDYAKLDLLNGGSPVNIRTDSNTLMKLAGRVDGVDNKAGSLASLTTTTKATLVDAINEVKAAALQLGSTAGQAPGVAAAGTATTAAHSDHVHPAQTSVSGNAGTATKLATPRTINGVAFDGSADITINAVDSTARIASSEKGAANGVAPLGADAKIAATYLPSYVDDVLEYTNSAAFPATGEAGKIYVDLATNKTWRWGGSAYVEISASPGSTDAVTEGATNLYFTTARASAAAPVQSVAGKTGAVSLAKADVGLANVDNTADSTKAVASAAKLTTARTINGVAFDGTAAITINAVDSTARIAASEKGVANGVVPLDATTKIAASFLPDLSATYQPKNNSLTSVAGLSTASTGLVKLTNGVASLDATAYSTLQLGSSVGTAPGTAAAGSATTAARSDHVHPLQTSVSGNAGTATKLAAAVNINGVAFDGSSSITVNAVDATARIAASEKGAANGVAPLGADSKIAATYLPSYVDDVLEYAAKVNFPGTGETGKIYTDLATNKIWRWSGSTYVEISASPGSTDAVPEGSVNLYHTTARAAAAAPVQSVAGKTGAVALAVADVSGAASASSVTAVDTKVGNLASLTTMAKDSLVNAVNEVAAAMASASSNAITQGDSAVTLSDTGSGSVVTTTLDGLDLLKVGPQYPTLPNSTSGTVSEKSVAIYNPTGNIKIQAAHGATNIATTTGGLGGILDLYAGDAGGSYTNATGGAVRLRGGNGLGSSPGGLVSITAGVGGATGAGGGITITAGRGGDTTGNGGNLTLASGNAIDGNGGLLNLTAGSAGSITNTTRTGGRVILRAMAGVNGGNNGGVDITAGGLTSSAGLSGGINIVTGVAKSVTPTAGSDGGNISIATSSASASTDGTTDVNKNGGSINIASGAGVGTGNHGNINLTAAGDVNLTSTNGKVLANGVAVATVAPKLDYTVPTVPGQLRVIGTVALGGEVGYGRYRISVTTPDDPGVGMATAVIQVTGFGDPLGASFTNDARVEVLETARWDDQTFGKIKVSDVTFAATEIVEIGLTVTNSTAYDVKITVEALELHNATLGNGLAPTKSFTSNFDTALDSVRTYAANVISLLRTSSISNYGFGGERNLTISGVGGDSTTTNGTTVTISSGAAAAGGTHGNVELQAMGDAKISANAGKVRLIRGGTSITLNTDGSIAIVATGAVTLNGEAVVTQSAIDAINTQLAGINSALDTIMNG